MTSRSLVDPEFLDALDVMPTLSLSRETLGQARDAMNSMFASMPVDLSLPVTVEKRTVPPTPSTPPVPLTIVRPARANGNLPAILHMHGGGYVVGSAAMMSAEHRTLALELGCVIASVDYRLAPETPHPGPIEDCYAALKWLYTSAPKLGVDPARIAITGESAGGGLAASLALLARDRGEVSVAFQHLIYPMLDDRTGEQGTPNPHTGQFVWTSQHNQFGWNALLGKAPGSEDVSPYAAAARATDLAGLPPAFIMVGALDLFLEEDTNYALRLATAGIAVELHVYAGAYHGFDLIPTATVSVNARRDSVNALRRALSGKFPAGREAGTGLQENEHVENSCQ